MLRVTPIETVTVDGEDTDFRHPEVTFRFVAAGTGPTIDATVGTEHFTNVVHLGGTKDALTTVTLDAVKGGADAGTFEWQIDGRPEKYTGPQFSPQPGELAGTQLLVLREKTTPPGGEEETRLAHLQLQVLEAGDLLVGCEAGVFAATDDATRLELAAVEATFDLSDFHAEGAFHTLFDDAELEPADHTTVSRPVRWPGARHHRGGRARRRPPLDRHVQILMDFDTANELRWGAARPAGATGALSQSDLLAWAARYPGAQFLVVGRCDDIGSDAYNKTLAASRAARGVTLLTALQAGQDGTPVAAASVASRGEQDAFAGTPDGNALEEDASLGMSANEKSEKRTDPTTHGRLIELDLPDSLAWPDDARYTSGVLSEHEPVRDDYRRVDIWAVGGTPAAAATQPTDGAVAPALRRSLVPASGRDPAPVTPGSPSLDYRVQAAHRLGQPHGLRHPRRDPHPGRGRVRLDAHRDAPARGRRRRRGAEPRDADRLRQLGPRHAHGLHQGVAGHQERG